MIVNLLNKGHRPDIALTIEEYIKRLTEQIAGVHQIEQRHGGAEFLCADARNDAFFHIPQFQLTVILSGNGARPFGFWVRLFEGSVLTICSACFPLIVCGTCFCPSIILVLLFEKNMLMIEVLSDGGEKKIRV